MIPFHQPWSSGNELTYIAQAIQNQTGPDAQHYTRACEQWLANYLGSCKAFLTPSCTAALEMSAILADIQPGDEIIMASFTFPSMANAFVLRGGIPVFVDIRADTLNIDENLIEAAITSRSRAIVVMHYGGVACEMDTIMALAEKHGLIVIEDAAHAIGATYKGRQLGSIGHLAAISFHKTKNIQCGEGGALLINAPIYIERAERVRENGTDKASFIRQRVAHYSWTDIGSSFIISEFSAAFLWAQMAHIEHILQQRKQLWQQYQHALQPAAAGPLTHNAHIFRISTNSPEQRQYVMGALLNHGIQSAPHYQPLHSSRAGRRHGKVSGTMENTVKASSTLLRLPLWPGLTQQDMNLICEQTKKLMLPLDLTASAGIKNMPHSLNL
ncbi:MAG: dTDP-4-amino-4,6-dideoxygalactose transaminase [Moraxellaceae bacterium]